MVNKSGQLLTELKKALEEDHKQREELIQEIKAIVAFIIDGDHWTLDLRPGKGFLVPGPPHGKDPADVVLKMSDATFVNLVMGKIASETAWLLRKIKISGSMLVAWRLDPILDAAAAKLQA